MVTEDAPEGAEYRNKVFGGYFKIDKDTSTVFYWNQDDWFPAPIDEEHLMNNSFMEGIYDGL